MKNSSKTLGNIYTPSHIVEMMLDYAGYVASPHIRKKHVIDNSCGDGAFLKEILRRYLISCKNDGGAPLLSLKKYRNELETYIHGIEIEPSECEKCKASLSSIAAEYGISDVQWDIKCANSLTVAEYDGKMDYVFGNPPYVRLHNIDDGMMRILRGFTFSEKGAADLYMAFYELGLRMRNGNGVLCYISPSAWINNLSGKGMREWLGGSHQLCGVIDFESTQVFEDAQTYVMVTLFENCPHAFVRYDRYDEQTGRFRAVSAPSYDEIFVGGRIFFGTETELDIIRKVEAIKSGAVEVKNGYATLADDIFIDNLPPISGCAIDVVKASTGVWKKCLFPYGSNMKPLSLDEIRSMAPDAYEYIIANGERLMSRTYDANSDGYWHLIGRSQGLNDTYRHKVSVNAIVRTPDDIKLSDVLPGQGVYGGLYILTEMGAEEIGKILKTNEFISYVKSLRKYKAGGYYTFSSKDLERYLNFVLSEKGK